MVGQTYLKSNLHRLREFPRFSIIVGRTGSGKKLFVQDYILKELNKFGLDNSYIAPDIKVDTIRTLISDAYKYRNTLFVIYDADNMSISAKNSLLKVVEDCPNGNCFLLTLTDLANTLDTIKSRAFQFYMDVYKPSEIVEYAKRFTLDKTELEIYKKVCTTPYEVQLVQSYGVIEFYEYVSLVVDKIADVSNANAFKIALKIAVKKDDTGYDLRLFWLTVIQILLDRIVDTDSGTLIDMYCDAIKLTGTYLDELDTTKSINKSMLLDMWILNMRESWS